MQTTNNTNNTTNTNPIAHLDTFRIGNPWDATPSTVADNIRAADHARKVWSDYVGPYADDADPVAPDLVAAIRDAITGRQDVASASYDAYITADKDQWITGQPIPGNGAWLTLNLSAKAIVSLAPSDGGDNLCQVSPFYDGHTITSVDDLTPAQAMSLMRAIRDADAVGDKSLNLVGNSDDVRFLYLTAATLGGPHFGLDLVLADGKLTLPAYDGLSLLAGDTVSLLGWDIALAL